MADIKDKKEIAGEQKIVEPPLLDMTTSGEAGAPAAAPVPRKAVKGQKHVPTGIAHVRSTFNNTMVYITDPRGGVISWSSSGKQGFKGARKSTAFAATMVGQDAARQALSRLSRMLLLFRTMDAGREREGEYNGQIQWSGVQTVS